MKAQRIGWILGLWTPVAVLALAFLATFMLVNFPAFWAFANSDMYADTLVARMMWEQKTLFPEGWVFGNQLYFVATPNLAALLYGLTGSMNLAMGLASTVMTVCIAAAFCWMLAPVASWRARILGCLVLFGSVVSTDFARSDAGQLFFVLCSYYACYLAAAFVALGVFIRLVLYPEPAVSRRIQLGGGGRLCNPRVCAWCAKLAPDTRMLPAAVIHSGVAVALRRHSPA